ncbi:hypothetical protein M2281_005765 [Mesorhizobium soli]|uniref:hypothetical protein n=1 Tax=Pseudaminobacter soli (ex Li et al. 2025) TaxID=1295366 RepID=UPI00247302AC|nr:hypothetical protein [Mesorhizobium soli]MDH6235143.1 hypothetical protein [Mesorhizobium soli]
MALISFTLAEDRIGAWHLAFDPDELHLFVGQAEPECLPDPKKGMMIEDFLITIPRGALHRRAHERLIEFLTTTLS